MLGGRDDGGSMKKALVAHVQEHGKAVLAQPVFRTQRQRRAGFSIQAGWISLSYRAWGSPTLP